jgi:hypothetical protein
LDRASGSPETIGATLPITGAQVETIPSGRFDKTQEMLATRKTPINTSAHRLDAERRRGMY